MKKFYLQVQNDGTITDAIEFPHGDYIEFEAESLPGGVYGGWWKLEDGELVEYPELKPFDEEEEIAQLREDLNRAILELSMMISVGGM